MQMHTVRLLELMNWSCHGGFAVMKVLDSDRSSQCKILLVKGLTKN